MKFTDRELIEELRDAAGDEATYPIVPRIKREDTVEWQAADRLRVMRKALVDILAGADPSETARAALGDEPLFQDNRYAR